MVVTRLVEFIPDIPTSFIRGEPFLQFLFQNYVLIVVRFHCVRQRLLLVCVDDQPSTKNKHCLDLLQWCFDVIELKNLFSLLNVII